MRTWWIAVVALAFIGCDKSSEIEDAPEDVVKEAAEENKEAPPKEESPSEVEVIPLEHGSLLLKFEETIIAVDPVSSALAAHPGDEPKADLVLVTHIHGDHLDPAAIATIRKPDAQVVVPKSVAEKAGDALPKPTLMANGENAMFLDNTVKVEAVAMYNLKRKREDNGEFFHPKGLGNGYVVTLGTKRIYLSGDTECTPEMKALKDIDMAFVCMNLPYTMTPDEASECIAAFKPKVLYPYHYRGQDPTTLTASLKDSGVTINQLEWYPASDAPAEEK